MEIFHAASSQNQECNSKFSILLENLWDIFKHAKFMATWETCYTWCCLTYWGPVTQKQTYHHWIRQWLVAWPAPSHYMNKCGKIVNWIGGNKHQWNSNRNSSILIQENAFKNVVWKMAANLSGPQRAGLAVGWEWVAVAIQDISTTRHLYSYLTHLPITYWWVTKNFITIVICMNEISWNFSAMSIRAAGWSL